MTGKELRSVAKAEGVCLGYAAARKDTMVDEIMEYLRCRDSHEKEGR